MVQYKVFEAESTSGLEAQLNSWIGQREKGGGVPVDVHRELMDVYYNPQGRVAKIVFVITFVVACDLQGSEQGQAAAAQRVGQMIDEPITIVRDGGPISGPGDEWRHHGQLAQGPPATQVDAEESGERWKASIETDTRPSPGTSVRETDKEHDEHFWIRGLTALTGRHLANPMTKEQEGSE